MNCKIKDISINYEIIGEGKPVLMLHGYNLDHRIMIGCMEPIFSNIDNYKRIYLDLPGMGKSECADWINSSDHMLDIVIEFIHQVIPSENFLIIGESYGGYLLRGVIFKMSHRVEGALLICPVIIPDKKLRNVPTHIVLQKDIDLLSKLKPEDAESFISNIVVQTKDVYVRYQNEVMAGINIADNAFLQILQQYGYEFSFHVDILSYKFENPSLFILGKQDDCVGFKDAWNILENYPRATFAVLDKAGHNLQIEQAEIFNTLVREWLIRVDEYINI